MLTWFNHETIDDGEDDEYFYSSFIDYVERMKRYNRENGQMRSFESGRTYWDEPICLMGAEDYWRWHSFEYDEDFDENHPDGSKVYRSDKIPCRCRFCKSRGVVQISH